MQKLKYKSAADKIIMNFVIVFRLIYNMLKAAL